MSLGDTIFTAQQYNKHQKELVECHRSINKLAATAFITGFILGMIVVCLWGTILYSTQIQ